MTDITHMLDAAANGDRTAYRALLPRVYDELRKLAAQHMAREQPGQTLQPTALVHEAFLRLVGDPSGQDSHSAKFSDRRYFFAAAGEAMRRILIDNARRKNTVKHGGQMRRIDLDTFNPVAPEEDGNLELLSAALDGLAEVDAVAAELVNLRWFAGRSMPEVAELMGLSLRSAERQWAYARAWLYQRLQE